MAYCVLFVRKFDTDTVISRVIIIFVLGDCECARTLVNSMKPARIETGNCQ